MKPFPLKNLCLLVLAGSGLFLASCASTIESRIQKYPGKYEGLPKSHRSLVTQGKIKDGMSRDAVYLSWGNPNDISSGEKSKKKIERWRYSSYEPRLVNNFGFQFGYGRYGRGYHGYHYSPEIYYVPYTSAVVDFVNGKVSSWERSGR